MSNRGKDIRLVGITECDVLEVSTPEIGTTYRLEDDYKRPDETEDQRKKERRYGMNNDFSTKHYASRTYEKMKEVSWIQIPLVLKFNTI